LQRSRWTCCRGSSAARNPPSYSRNAEVYDCLLQGNVQMMEAIRASVPEAVLMLESILPKL